MNYGARTLRGSAANRARYRGGNAAPDADTMGGVFGNQSRGGGIFSGVGEYFSAETPTGLGEYFSAGEPRRIGRRGMGVTETLPEVVIVGNAPAAMPWREYSAETARIQGLVNPKLAAGGYCTRVDTDGKLGPATCGALDAVWPEMVPGTCKEFTPPKKTGCAGGSSPSPAPSPSPSPSPAPTPTGPGVKKSALAGQGLLIAGVLAVGVGAFMFARKRRNKR